MEPWVASLQSPSGSDPVAIVFEALALLSHSTNTTDAGAIQRRTHTDEAILTAHLIGQHAHAVVLSTCRGVMGEAWWASRPALAAMLASSAGGGMSANTGINNNNGSFEGNHNGSFGGGLNASFGGGASQGGSGANLSFVERSTNVTPFTVASAALSHLRDGAPAPLTAANLVVELAAAAPAATRALFRGFPISNSPEAVDAVLAAAELARTAASARGTSTAATAGLGLGSRDAVGNFHKLLTRLMDCLAAAQSVALKAALVQTVTQYLQLASVLLEGSVLAVVAEDLCEDTAIHIGRNRRAVRRSNVLFRGRAGASANAANHGLSIDTNTDAPHHVDPLSPGAVAADEGEDGGASAHHQHHYHQHTSAAEQRAVDEVWDALCVEVSRLLLPPQWLADALRLLPEAALTYSYAAHAAHQQASLEDANTGSQYYANNNGNTANNNHSPFSAKQQPAPTGAAIRPPPAAYCRHPPRLYVLRGARQQRRQPRAFLCVAQHVGRGRARVHGLFAGRPLRGPLRRRRRWSHVGLHCQHECEQCVCCWDKCSCRRGFSDDARALLRQPRVPSKRRPSGP